MKNICFEAGKVYKNLSGWEHGKSLVIDEIRIYPDCKAVYGHLLDMSSVYSWAVLSSVYSWAVCHYQKTDKSSTVEVLTCLVNGKYQDTFKADILAE